MEVRAEHTRAENARRDAEETERELALRLEQIEDERRNVLEQARRTAAKELDTLRDELSELKRKLARAASLGQSSHAADDDEAETPGDLLDAVDSGLVKAESAHTAPVAARPGDTGRGAPVKRAIRLGDTVKLKHLNSIGVVTALTATEAEVQVGRMRIRAKLDEIALRASPEEEILAATRPAPAPTPEAAPKVSLHPSPGLELDLRGQIVEDALAEGERYLDAAYLAGLPWVRLIHGKGTGKLRQAVREYLRNSPVVKSHETGQEGEGGDGVTVVKLALAAD